VKRKKCDYSNYVEHPRYGRGPRFTGIQPREVPPGFRLTTYLSKNKIGGTAVEANLDQQTFCVVPVLYYFDLKRDCVDCGRPFIFFAEEQKHWYETLGFVVYADCVRCVECRSRGHDLERKRRRYEELFHREQRNIQETLEMAECSLALIDHGVFHHRQAERVRMLLNSLPDDRDDAVERSYKEIQERLNRIDSQEGGEDNPE